MTSAQLIHDTLRGALIVSCQPAPGGPFDSPDSVASFAVAAHIGGASAVRIEGLRNIQAVRKATDQLVIGLVKRDVIGTDVYITPTLQDVMEVVDMGADVVAFDATDRQREVPVRQFINLIQELGLPAMADISTFEEGLEAHRLGATYVGTTLSGYTAESPNAVEPDLDLVRKLSEAGVTVIAEGRINSPTLARRALELGAYAVTVGTMITRPECITGAYVEAMKTLSLSTGTAGGGPP